MKNRVIISAKNRAKHAGEQEKMRGLGIENFETVDQCSGTISENAQKARNTPRREKRLAFTGIIQRAELFDLSLHRSVSFRNSAISNENDLAR